jgi:hypothetical protein
MAFNFGKLLSIVKAVAKTTIFESAADLALKRVGEEITKHADHPEEIKKIGAELIRGAPELVGAIVKGTEAEPLVNPALIHRTPEEAHSGEVHGSFKD